MKEIIGLLSETQTATLCPMEQSGVENQDTNGS